MKKILLSTIVLTAFALSICLFQLSCKKTANAQSSNTIAVSQQNKIIYLNFTTTAAEIWTANSDGSNQQKLNVSLPTGVVVPQDSGIKVSLDGKTIFFNAFTSNLGGNPSDANAGIWVCNIDGSNAHLIVKSGSNGNSFGAAY